MVFQTANPSGSSVVAGANNLQWYFSQVKGTMDDEVSERNKGYKVSFNFGLIFNFTSS